MNLSQRQFRDRVKQINPTLVNIPRGYKRIENKIILRYNSELTPELGLAVLKAYSWCTGVFQHLNTEGENRRPKIKYLAGDARTEVIHMENKTLFCLDFSKITFSGGNSNLRKKLVTEINPDENLLDMFAAVGNLSLQVIVHKKVQAILIEKDPYTFSYLEKSININNVSNCQLFNMDCRDLDVENWADRVLMGYHNLDESHLIAAVRASKKKAKLHLHPLVLRGESENQINLYTSWIVKLGVKIVNASSRKIKNYSPKLDHIEIVLTIEK